VAEKGDFGRPFYMLSYYPMPPSGLDDVQGGFRVHFAAIFGGQSPATFLSVDP
jgi:hypothetical protein